VQKIKSLQHLVLCIAVLSDLDLRDLLRTKLCFLTNEFSSNDNSACLSDNIFCVSYTS